MKKLFILTFSVIASVILIQQTNLYFAVAQDKQEAKSEAKSQIIHKSEGQLRSSAINKAIPAYPAEAKEKKVEGDVTVEVKVNEEGKVISAKYVSGPEIFTDSVVKAAKEWTFKPNMVKGEATKVAGVLSFRFKLETFTEAMTKANSQATSESSEKENSVPEVLPPSIIRRSEGVIRGLAINKALPEYPLEAREQKVEGDVVVEITINEEGNIASSRVVSGPELLRNSALEAAKQWTFKTTTLDSHPVKVSGVITFRFKL